MELIDAFNQFKKDYLKLMDDFSILDEQDPLSKSTIDALKGLLEKFLNHFTINFSERENLKVAYEDKKQLSKKNYHALVDELNNGLEKNIKNITYGHIEACKNLKNKIENTKQNHLFTNEQLELDYDYFITTSEQNKIILSSDYDNAKKRYDYQKEEAKDSYFEIVKKNNKILEEVKNQLYKEYVDSIAQYKEDQQALLAKLEENVSEKTIELETLMAALENEKNNMKEKYRLESANLNKSIQKYLDEKNKTIDHARSQYSRAINDAAIERENKKQIYQNNLQALLKEFVTKITEIDESSTQKRKEFEAKTDRIKREYYSTVFTKTKVFHQQIENIYASSSSKNLDKYTQHLIQFKNKQHLIDVALIKKSTEQILTSMTQEHTIDLQESKNNKNFLEIDKNYAVKNIANQEQFDNKYYQEKDNVYENDFNYIVKTANFNFSQKANLLRCQSEIRTKLLERNYDGIEANYYKKIETIQNKINAYKLEIKLAQELKELVLQYQEEKYHLKLHLEEVTNLLEIEKNKLLKLFNISQYEYNVKNITLSKDYGFKKIELENQKAETFKNLKIELENALLKKNTVSTSFSIKKEQLEEKFSKMKTQIKNNKELNVAKEQYLTDLKNADIYFLNQEITAYHHFFDSFQRSFLEAITLLMKESSTLTNYHYLDSLIHSFVSIFLRFFLDSFSKLYETIIQTIDNRLDFIHLFKYKNSLDSLRDNYLEYQTKIKENRNTILDEIDSSNKTIENFRQKIYTLINDNEMLIQNNKYRKRKSDAASQTAIKDNELKIKEYKEKIDNFTQMNKMHSADLAELNQKIITNSNLYNTELKKINKMQLIDSKINRTFKRTISTYYTKVCKMVQHFKVFLQKDVFTDSGLHKKIKQADEEFNFILSYTKDNLQNFFYAYAKENEKETLCHLNLIKEDFQQDIVHFNKQYSKANANFQKEYHLTITSYEKQITEQNIKMNQILNHFDSLLVDANTSFQTETNEIKRAFNRTTDQFLTSYYALEENNQKIIHYYHTMFQNKESQFKISKDTSIQNKLREKELNNDKLKNFIITKNEEIQHLPIAFKFNSRMLNNETKKKNNQIHLDIRQAKIDFNTERKRIDKEISNLRNQLNQSKNQNDLNQKQSINQEKRDNRNSLKQAIKSIQINL